MSASAVDEFGVGGGGDGQNYATSSGANGGLGGGGGGATSGFAVSSNGGPGGDGGFGGGGGGGGDNWWSQSPGGSGGFGGGDGAPSVDIDRGGDGGGGAGMGGAIMNLGGIVQIINSTLAENSAHGGNGASNGQGLGGAIFSRGGNLTIYNSTIASNTVSDDGGGIYALGEASGNITLTIHSTIIASTPDDKADVTILDLGAGNATVSGGHNLVGLSGNQTITALSVSKQSPLLGALDDNGGPTKTMALDGGSPAIGQGSNLLTLVDDQRGASRSRSGVVDIGALQLLSMAPTITSITRGTPTAEETNAGNVTFTVTFDQDVTGVDAADFGLTGAAAGNASIVQVTGNGSIYEVKVSTASAEGTLGLNAVAGGISNSASQLFGGTVGTSESYSLDHVAPPTPVITSQASFTLTPNGHYTVTGTAAANTLVELYLDNDLVDSVQLTGGATTFSFNAELRVGSNVFHVTSTDRHGNASPMADVSEIIRTQVLAVGTAPGGKSAPLVKVYDAISGELYASFLAYEPKFIGGVRVTTGDLDNDGQVEIIVTPASKRRTEVKVFSITGEELTHFEFIASKSNQTYGSVVAVGDVDGDGWKDIVLGAGSGQTSHIRVFKNNFAQAPEQAFAGTPLVDFEAFTDRYKSGVSLATGDVNDDGVDEIVVGSNAGYVTQVSVFAKTNALTPTFAQLTNFRPFGDKFKGGVSVSVGDLDGDGKAEVVTAPARKGARSFRSTMVKPVCWSVPRLWPLLPTATSRSTSCSRTSMATDGSTSCLPRWPKKGPSNRSNASAPAGRIRSAASNLSWRRSRNSKAASTWASSALAHSVLANSSAMSAGPCNRYEGQSSIHDFPDSLVAIAHLERLFRLAIFHKPYRRFATSITRPEEG